MFAPAQNIGEVIQQLEDIIQDALQNNDPLGIFPSLYQKVTLLVKEGIQNGRFENGPRMERLDVIFANRYLQAYHQFTHQQKCTKAWQPAFIAARKPHLILQHLLAGMNAHINLDLGIAAAETVASSGLQDLKVDFFEISKILTSQIENTQQQLNELSPMLFLLDWVGKKTDERFAAFSLRKARSHAWRVAKRLAPLNSQQKEEDIRELDGYVAILNKLITRPGMLGQVLVRLIGWFEEKDVSKIIRGLQPETN
ncbi:MAG: DUF5995 family protein [Saprospiraceae bacterium]